MPEDLGGGRHVPRQRRRRRQHRPADLRGLRLPDHGSVGQRSWPA